MNLCQIIFVFRFFLIPFFNSLLPLIVKQLFKCSFLVLEIKLYLKLALPNVPTLVCFLMNNEFDFQTLGSQKIECIKDGLSKASINSVRFKFGLIKVFLI